MATKKPKKSGGGRKPGRWAKNTEDSNKRAAERSKSGKVRENREDAYVRGRRIRDEGQAVPKGYMRTGGKYFAKVENMRPIRSQTTSRQRALVYGHRNRFWGADGKSGWLGSVGRTGMYDGSTGDANFRKTTAARKVIDGQRERGAAPGSGKSKGGKSRYIIAFGQDGHMR